MKVLITGGAGFIGSHLTEELERLDHEVWTVDPRPLPGHRAIQGLIQNCDRILNGHSYDVIYHCGAMVGVQDVIANPKRCVENEIAATQAVANLAFDCSARLIYLSSSDVYGHHSPGESRETDNLGIGPLDKPRWSYAAAKAAGEHLVRWSECESVVCRLFNIAGPRQRPEAGVIAKWCKLAVEGKPLPIYGDGRQTRTFLHVLDLVDALVLLGTCPKENLPDLCNIGGSVPHTMDNIADTVFFNLKMLEYGPREKTLVSMSFDGDEPRDKLPNLDRIKGLGWEERLTWSIIPDTLRYWRER